MPLHLLATLHVDSIAGPEKLRGYCERTRPKVLLTEGSSVGMEKREQLAKNLFANLSELVTDHDTLKCLIRQGLGASWEYQTSKEYAEKHNVQHLALDSFESGSQQEWEQRYRQYLEGLSRELSRFEDKRQPNQRLRELYRMSSLNTENEARRMRQVLAALWDEHDPRRISIALSQADVVVRGRDENWERMIRAIYNPSIEVVCIVGGLHMLDSPGLQTLYTRLKDLSPSRTVI